jgi:sigma-B regulation protein RsbU (phosphoserine phosphatase)
MLGNSLTTRLAATLTLCIALTLTAINTIDYQISKRRILKEVEISAETTVARAARDIEVRLASLEESTELLAEVLSQTSYTEAELVALLRDVVDDREDLFGAALAIEPRWTENPKRGFAAYFYYDQGEISYTDLAGNYDYVLRSWFREPASSGQSGWSEPYFDEGGGNVYMSTYSAPVFRTIDGNREFFGVVTADITLDELQYYLDRIELGESGIGFLLSRSGKIMATQNRDNLLRPVLQALPPGQDVSRWAEMLTAVIGGQNASSRVPCEDESDHCIVKLAPLSSTGWPLGVYYSEREMLAPLREYLLKTVLSEGITLVLLLIVVIWVSRRITKPLRALAIATVDISTGNFHTPLPSAQSRDELGRLVHAFSIMQGNLQRYIAQLEKETAARNRLEGELAAAAEIQMSMLPAGGQASVEESAFSLWASLRPAKSVGGDLYAFHLEESRRLFIAVGDVSDKGVPAAIFMARAMTLLQQYAQAGLDPEVILAQLNDDLVEGNENCMFLTLFAGWLDLETLQLHFASGGHTPPSLRRGGTCESIELLDGPALGLAENLEFPVNALQLEPGDLLAIYTDGVDEAFNAEGEQFGIEAMNELLLQHRPLPELGQSSFDAVDLHAGSTPQSDDITVMLLELPASTEAGETRQLRLNGNEQTVSQLLKWLSALLSQWQLDASLQREMILVAEEVTSNIINYGELAPEAEIELTVALSEHDLCMNFSDPGIAFDPLSDACRSPLGEDTDHAEIGGLGVHLLQAMTDQQEYRRSDDQNHLRLVKQL